MRKLLSAVVMAGAATFAGQAWAEQLWDPYLRGVNEGLAAGALPPQGVYFVLDNYLAEYNLYSPGNKQAPNTGLTAFVGVPIVLWSTGVKILGADFAVAVAQPFDYTSVNSGYGHPPGQGNWGTFNTILVPGQLAWTFGDYHIKTGLEVYLPTASSTVNTSNWRGGLPSGNDFWAVQPDLAFSWLHDGWNISADLHFAFPVSSSNTAAGSYHSGNEFAADYTVAKTFGKWTFGVGAHQENQFNADTLNGASVPNSIVTNFGLGPLVGYQFGGIGVIAEWNHNIYARNDVAGNFFNFRFVVPL